MELILGTAQLSRSYGVLSQPQQQKKVRDPIELIRASALMGFSAIDTAPVYGEAEKTVGRSGTTQMIHTKLRPSNKFASSLTMSLMNLQRQHVDVMYLHDTNVLSRLDRRTRGDLLSLVPQGVSLLGASVYDEEEFRKALDARVFDVIQVPLNLLDLRFAGRFMELAHHQGVRVYVRSVFLQGVLLANPRELPDPVRPLAPYLRKFRGLCEGWGIDPIQGLVRFIVDRTAADGIIFGASRVGELEKIAQAMHVEVPDEFLDELQEIEKPDRSLVDPRRWS